MLLNHSNKMTQFLTKTTKQTFLLVVVEHSKALVIICSLHGSTLTGALRMCVIYCVSISGLVSM